MSMVFDLRQTKARKLSGGETRAIERQTQAWLGLCVHSRPFLASEPPVDSNGADGAEAASESRLVAMVSLSGQIKATWPLHSVNRVIYLQSSPTVSAKGHSRPPSGLEVPAGHLRRRGRSGTSGVAALVNGTCFG